MIGLVRAVSIITGMPIDACRRVAHSAHRRYKVFEIPKRSGKGVRVIAQPAREVKEIQRALCEILTPLLTVHKSATAYKQGSSIILNAQAHAGASYITKLDFTRFFPSIDYATIDRLLRQKVPNISDAEVGFVIRSCMWKPDGAYELCMGAPSSPLLSNAALFDFDESVYELCNSMDVIYTRYSDDITLSTAAPGILAAAEDGVCAVLRASRYPRLKLNADKRVAVGRGKSMRVTGLVLANDGLVTVGRNRKRGVRAGVNRFFRTGLTDKEFERLKGEIAFVLSVEPEFRAVLQRTYGVRVNRLLPLMRVDWDIEKPRLG